VIEKRRGAARKEIEQSRSHSLAGSFALPSAISEGSAVNYIISHFLGIYFSFAMLK
jgi:hypothetical protein